jgi:hypothetical protein
MSTQSNIQFFTINEFKALINATTLSVVRNPVTNKLFVAVDTQRYKCQQDIDKSLPMAILYDTDTKEYCLVNATNNLEFTL